MYSTEAAMRLSTLPAQTPYYAENVLYMDNQHVRIQIANPIPYTFRSILRA